MPNGVNSQPAKRLVFDSVQANIMYYLTETVDYILTFL